MPLAYLYDADGKDREIDLATEPLDGLGENRLLWVNVDSAKGEDLSSIVELLGIDARSIDRIGRANVRPRLDNYGSYFQFTLYAEPLGAKGKAGREDGGRRLYGEGAVKLDVLVGAGWMVTVHDGAVRFLDDYRAQDKAETLLGTMSAQALTASLLDWFLETYFDAVSDLEEQVDRLEEQVLVKSGGRMSLGRMTALKRRVSALRSLLASQRRVFYGLARPDFVLVAECPAAAAYNNLVARFERAIDEVEHLHDLVDGSFELFTSRTTLETNDLVKALTFLTVVIGLCAAVAGIFGMNFAADVLRTGDHGFNLVVLGQGLALAAAGGFVFWKRWL